MTGTQKWSVPVLYTYIILQQKVTFWNYYLLFLEQIERKSPSHSREWAFGIACQKVFLSDTTVRVNSYFIAIKKACNYIRSNKSHTFGIKKDHSLGLARAVPCAQNWTVSKAQHYCRQTGDMKHPLMIH